MSVLQGNPELVLIERSHGNDPQSGPFIRYVWQGLYAACLAGANELGNAVQWEISGGGATRTLAAQFTNDPTEGGSGEVPVREERLRFNRVSVPIYSHPTYAEIDATDMALIRDAVDNREDLPEDLALAVPLAVELHGLAMRGVESLEVNQPIVTVVDTASKDFQWNIGFDDEGEIFHTPGMIADAALESGWKANLPTKVAPAGFMYGWKKGPPEIATVGGNKTQLVQEYEYGLWPVPPFEAA